MALPGGLGLQPDRYDSQDFPFARVANARLGLAPLPPVVDLQPRCSAVRDQAQENSCTAFAWGTGLLEYYLRQKGDPTVVATQFLYYEERKRQHQLKRDNGASLRDGARVLFGMGCCPEA